MAGGHEPGCAPSYGRTMLKSTPARTTRAHRPPAQRTAARGMGARRPPFLTTGCKICVEVGLSGEPVRQWFASILPVLCDFPRVFFILHFGRGCDSESVGGVYFESQR